MTYALSLAQVRKLKPCTYSFSRVSTLLPKRGKIDAAKARELGCTYDDIVWAASAVAMNDSALARRLTMFVNDSAKAVLHIWEARFPSDLRPRQSIDACDAFLAGTGTEDQWRQAAGAVRAARDPGAARVARAAKAACDAWDAWVVRAAWSVRAAWAAGAAGDAFLDWQFTRLVYVLTAPDPVPLPMPEIGKPLPEIAALTARIRGEG